MGEKLEQLKEHLGPISDLMRASAVLSWDQEVNMPEKGVGPRSDQMATLRSMAHELFTSDETAEILEAAEDEVADLDYDTDEASLVRVTRRLFDKRTKIPTELVKRESKATSQGFVAWRRARETDDYTTFEPHLEELVDIQVEKADYLGYEEHPYDALLDQFEPGMTTAQVAALFSDLKDGLVPLAQVIAEKPEVDDSFLEERTYDEERQWDFTMLLLRDIGYDFSRGRQDRAPHPFTTEFGNSDVRVTTRFSDNHPESAIYSSVHEGGHALYELGSPDKFERTPLAGGATLGVHESQSRLWENQVGRSMPFWQHYYPILRAFFPDQLGDVSLTQFHRAINKVEPTLIRVEADEVTYNLHIFVRFELEQALVTGDLKVADVPEAWNSKYESYLGITPPNDAQGCLQDIHWSHGTIGYFPTYALGNLMAAQIYHQAQQDLPDLESGFARAEFGPLLSWLRERVHSHGAKFTAPELMSREFGVEMSAQPLLAYLREKYT
ncbi:MAG: carboxypeptidase M32, partial [Anaerolineae bacterium]